MKVVWKKKTNFMFGNIYETFNWNFKRRWKVDLDQALPVLQRNRKSGGFWKRNYWWQCDGASENWFYRNTCICVIFYVLVDNSRLSWCLYKDSPFHASTSASPPYYSLLYQLQAHSIALREHHLEAFSYFVLDIINHCFSMIDYKDQPSKIYIFNKHELLNWSNA